MAEMKRLIFGEGLMFPTLTGEKQITLRKYRAGSHDFVKGEVIRGEFKDGLNVLLQITADTEKKPATIRYEIVKVDGTHAVSINEYAQ